MMKAEGKLGVRELIGILVLSVGTRATDDTPVLYTIGADNAGWIVPLMSGVLSIISFLFLLKVFSAHKHKDLIDVLTHLFGKWVGIMVAVLLLCILIGGFTAETAIYTNIISTMYFPKTPLLILYALIMIVSVYGARTGLQQIGSVSWMVLAYVKITMGLALIITLWQGVHFYMFPLLGPGVMEIAKESITKTSTYIDFLVIGLLLPHIRNFKDFKRGTLIALLFVTLEITLATLAFILLFDYITVSNLNYPFHESIRYIRIGFLTNIETFFFPFWLIASFIKFSFYLYIVTYLYGRLFRIQSIKKILPIMAVVILFLGMFPETPTFTIFSVKENLMTIVSPFFLLLPFLMWTIAKLKGDFRNEKQKENH
ncbi:endospore germination permease [Bacillus carboniphilus]|uniref:Endospore germination permease n=1 Tax=Bacillus carboniphilus TaxID=86663 RepID=A0ABN0VRF9_9BACI